MGGPGVSLLSVGQKERLADERDQAEMEKKVWFSGISPGVSRLLRVPDLLRVKARVFLTKMIDLNLLDHLITKPELNHMLKVDLDTEGMMGLLMQKEQFAIQILEKNHGKFIYFLEQGAFFGDRIFGQDSERMATAIPLVVSDLLVVGKAGYMKSFKGAIELDMEKRMGIVKGISPQVTASFSRRHMWNIIYASSIKEYRKGEVIVEEGKQKADSVGYLLEGEVEVCKRFLSGAYFLPERLTKEPSNEDAVSRLESEHRTRVVEMFRDVLESGLAEQDMNEEVVLSEVGRLQAVTVEAVSLKQEYLFTCRAKTGESLVLV